MDSEQYVKDAIRTESSDFTAISTRLSSDKIKRILHATIGVSTEAGELLDQVKKHIFYGRAMDDVNLAEEMGDLFWYCAILSDAIGISFVSILEANVKKLRARYGSKFSEERAENRDLSSERKILDLMAVESPEKN